MKLTWGERGIKQCVTNLLRNGCPADEISISGIQNPGLRGWAEKKGVIWNLYQKVDVIAPDNYAILTLTHMM